MDRIQKHTCDNTFRTGEGDVQTNLNSWLMRVAYQKDNYILQDIDRKKEAILVKNQAIVSVYEYAPNKLVAYCFNSCILIIENWEITKQIDDRDEKNTTKLSIAPVLGFDEETFPFIVLTGQSSFNILNVKDEHF